MNPATAQKDFSTTTSIPVPSPPPPAESSPVADVEAWLPPEMRESDQSEGAAVEEWAPPSQVEAAPSGESDRLREELDRTEEEARLNQERADRAERELSHMRERIVSMKRAAARAAATRHPGSVEPVTEAGGTLNLNEATFEALRATGLTVNQAARVIGHRDQRGGFGSLDDVDSVPGLPLELKQSLKDRAAV